MKNKLTPIQEISPNVFVKREDYAGYSSDEL